MGRLLGIKLGIRRQKTFRKLWTCL